MRAKRGSITPQYPDFQRRLQAFLTDRGLTKTCLAEALGLETSTVSNYGRRNLVPAETLIKLSDLYGVSLNWLLLGEGPMYKRALSSDLSLDAPGQERRTFAAPLLESMAQLRVAASGDKASLSGSKRMSWPIRGVAPSGKVFSVRLEDDDMMPVLCRTWPVAAELWSLPCSGSLDLGHELVVVDFGSRVTVRWLERGVSEWRLLAQDPTMSRDIAETRYPLSDPPKILAKVRCWLGER
jgi:hypothetical protein